MAPRRTRKRPKAGGDNCQENAKKKLKTATVTDRKVQAAKRAAPSKTVTGSDLDDVDLQRSSQAPASLALLPSHTTQLLSTPSLVNFARSGGPDLTDLRNASICNAPTR